MASQVKVCTESVRSLAELLRDTDLSEIEYQYQVDSLKIRVARHVSPPVMQAPSQHVAQISDNSIKQQAEEKKNDDLSTHKGVISAQMVGTVYLSPGPNTDTYVKLGDTVKEGQTLFIIEAMKVMNMIKATRSGVVKHIFVRDSQPVEYGEPIMIVE